MVQDHHSVRLDGTENIVAAAPGEVSDGLPRGLDRRQGLPAVIRGGALRRHHLALPHDDEAVLGAAAQDPLLRVVGDRVDLIVEELPLEGGLVDG